jgi:hypothetical protein
LGLGLCMRAYDAIVRSFSLGLSHHGIARSVIELKSVQINRRWPSILLAVLQDSAVPGLINGLLGSSRIPLAAQFTLGSRRARPLLAGTRFRFRYLLSFT